jgi:hypothetical protein
MTKKQIEKTENNVPRFRTLYKLTRVPKWAQETKEKSGLKVGDVGSWCDMFGFSKRGDKYTYGIPPSCIEFYRYVKISNRKRPKAKQVFKRT